MKQPCLRCGKKRKIKARGICSPCYDRVRATDEESLYPTTRKPRNKVSSREYLMEEMFHCGFDPNQPVTAQLRNLAPRIGVTVRHLERVWSAHLRRSERV